jgi:hypothetical protein
MGLTRDRAMHQRADGNREWQSFRERRRRRGGRGGWPEGVGVVAHKPGCGSLADPWRGSDCQRHQHVEAWRPLIGQSGAHLRPCSRRCKLNIAASAAAVAAGCDWFPASSAGASTPCFGCACLGKLTSAGRRLGGGCANVMSW